MHHNVCDNISLVVFPVFPTSSQMFWNIFSAANGNGTRSVFFGKMSPHFLAQPRNRLRNSDVIEMGHVALSLVRCHLNFSLT